MNIKLKRIKLKYGYAGWGLYWHVLELIASELDPPRKQDCVFEGDALILSDTFTNENKVNEMLEYFVEIGLFTKNEKNQYINLKLLERLDETTKRKTRKNYGHKETNPEDTNTYDGTIRNNPEQSGQSKVKESKVKESKVKESKVKGASKSDAPKTKTTTNLNHSNAGEDNASSNFDPQMDKLGPKTTPSNSDLPAIEMTADKLGIRQ
jgi:hypothetical protein